MVPDHRPRPPPRRRSRHPLKANLQVLHIIPAFQPAVPFYGGPVISVSGLCHGLQANGHRVRVLTTDSASPSARLDVDTTREIEWRGIPVRYCRRNLPESVSLALLQALPEAIEWADVVHLTGVYNFPTFPVLNLCRRRKKPLVWSPRGALMGWRDARKPRLKSLWNGFAQRSAPPGMILHATTPDERSRSESAMPGRDWCVVPNGVSIGPEKPPRAPGPPRALFVGRLDPIKALDNLIAAFGILEKSGAAPGLSLTIAGTGDPAYEADLRQHCATHGVSGRIHFQGFAGDRDKPAAFAAADFVVAPSHSENFGMSVAEALAHAVPVLVSRHIPWREVEPAGCGIVVDNDPSSLAAALVRMTSLDLAAMGQAGQQWMHRDYSWSGRAAEMAAVYQNLLSA